MLRWTVTNLKLQRNFQKARRVPVGVPTPQAVGIRSRLGPGEVMVIRTHEKGSVKKHQGVCKWVRGMSFVEAEAQLYFHQQRTASVLREMLLQAREQAEKKGLDREQMIISIATTTRSRGGMMVLPASRGNTHNIKVHRCHFYLVASQITPEAMRLVRKEEQRLNGYTRWRQEKLRQLRLAHCHEVNFWATLQRLATQPPKKTYADGTADEHAVYHHRLAKKHLAELIRLGQRPPDCVTADGQIVVPEGCDPLAFQPSRLLNPEQHRSFVLDRKALLLLSDNVAEEDSEEDLFLREHLPLNVILTPKEKEAATAPPPQVSGGPTATGALPATAAAAGSTADAGPAKVKVAVAVSPKKQAPKAADLPPAAQMPK
eukprot:TRINITY_DN15490_c0_g1_i2.p1 TRINITY_DN15490_c0_g1~~TRINITY_DN15490_c0_g1_i2.p1  ORF type:complete len:380 (+),score=99.27 TRINITY_DN15490_c0_g1_i2:23-1141(+)